jgi:50S ribosomal protein L16 3-hydroxylase
MNLETFDSEAFLRDYWQRKPLLIRNPWAQWRNPLEPDDLAGLACEEEVEARLVVAKAGKRKVEHGPFAESRFAKLGKSPWTLLVQAVDHLVPDVAALIAPFRFIPDWRIDDVMVSYASDGGGVGPHFDQYDVFLIQGLGRRRWRIGAPVSSATELAPHADLRLLANFEATEEWVLEPGDILYVPPGIPHDGEAVGDDCMTYSVGFRAPARSELVWHWCDDLIADLDEDDRYADPGLAVQTNPGEISAEALAGLHAMVTQTLGDRDAFAHWFGRYNTAPKNPEIDWRPEETVDADEIRKLIAAGTPLLRNPASRFAFAEREGGSLWLFVDGEAFACEGALADFARNLCASDALQLDPAQAASEPVLDLLATLFNQGSVGFDCGD